MALPHPSLNALHASGATARLQRFNALSDTIMLVLYASCDIYSQRDDV